MASFNQASSHRDGMGGINGSVMVEILNIKYDDKEFILKNIDFIGRVNGVISEYSSRKARQK